MANYYNYSRTNYFRVTDEAAFNKLFQNLRANDADMQDFTKTEDGVTLHGFGAEGSIDYYLDPDEEDPESDFDEFTSQLQKILPEDEAFILIEIGHMKLCELSGFGMVVTKHDIKSVDLNSWLTNTAYDMLEDPSKITHPWY